ncbi:MAG: tetratricopeptide repeat protein, partial [Phycisphaerales bacterium]|nr:tetratricopeptide repeat protein [Phycisphaerales bacterium]
KSAASLRRAMEIMPQNPQTIVSLMRVLLAMNEPNQALEVARGALRFGINEQAFVQLWLNLEFDFGDRAKAIDRRQRIFENNPEVTENAVSLATIMLRADRLDDAAKVITALEGNDADEIKTQAKLLRAAEIGLRGDSTRSEALFDEAVPKLNQNLLDGSLHIDFARMMEQQGKLDLAMRVLQKGRRYQRPETMFVDRTLGDMMFTNGRFVDALAAYTRARESVPKDDENLLRKRMVECLLRLERLEEAGRELAEMNPDKSEDTQVLLLASELARARGDRASAVKFLDKGVEQDPRSAVARVRRADFLIEDPAKFEDAVREYEEALRLDPKNARARLMYAECWARRGDVNRAVEELRSGLNQAENDEVRNAYVRLLLSLGRIADAANAASDGFKKSGDPKWVALEGFIHQQVGNLQLAADKFNQAWELRPGPVSGKQLVDVLLTMVPPEAARARAVIENPAFGADTTALGRFARARLSMIDRRAEQASADVKAALSTLNLTDVREGLSVMEEMTLIWPNPADLVTQLDSMMPSGGWPESMRLNIVTRRLLVESQRSEALAELERLAGSKEPRISISALSVMGTTYFNTNEPEKAVAAYRRGLEIDKDNLELLNNLAFVLSKGLKQHAEALPLAERAAAKAPTEPNIIDTLGAIKLEMGNIDEAQRDFERARSLSFDALVRTMPTVHLIEVKLRRREMIPADQLLRELEEYEQRDVRVRANYGREIDRVRELRRSTR